MFSTVVSVPFEAAKIEEAAAAASSVLNPAYFINIFANLALVSSSVNFFSADLVIILTAVVLMPSALVAFSNFFAAAKITYYPANEPIAPDNILNKGATEVIVLPIPINKVEILAIEKPSSCICLRELVTILNPMAN
jgi:hypothetical protein